MKVFFRFLLTDCYNVVCFCRVMRTVETILDALKTSHQRNMFIYIAIIVPK